MAAGDATIGAIRVILGADTAKLEENLKSAIGSLEGFGKAVAKIAAGIGIGITAEKAFGQVVEAINQAIDAADKLSKASQKFGIPVETLSALSNAAALSDVSLDQLGSSLSRLSKNMIAAQGPTSEQAAAFRALGVSTKDASGQFKSTDDILLAVADAFSKFRDGATKTALAVAIFGKAGADLIPFLNEGKKGIAELTGRMQELGIVINADTAKAAEKFNDDLKLLEQAKTALILKIVGESGLLNAMVQLTEAMLGGSKAATQLADIFTNKLGAAMVEVRKFVDDVNAGLKDFGAGGKTQSFLESIKNIGTTAAAAQAGGVDALIHGVESLEAAQRKAATAPPVFDPEAAKKLEAFRTQIERLNAAAIDASGLFAGRLAPGFLQAAAGMEILKGQVKLGADGVANLGLQAEQLNQALLRVQGAKLVQDSLPIWDQFNLKIAQADAALRAFGATDAQIFAQHIALSGNAVAATGQFFSFLQQGAAAAGEKNKEFAFAAKQLSVVQATINTYEAATKAFTLFGGWPLGAAAAAATVAAGLALVAKIEATPLAKGGSFRVPGGVSGVDTHLIPLALSSGEQVDVTPAHQSGGSGRSSTITLEGIGPRDLFTGTMLRDLVEALNQGHRDGYRLKLGGR